MARNIEQIENEIINTVNADTRLSALNSESKSAVWRLIVYIIAYSIYTLEMLFDTHKSEVDGVITLLKPHTRRWYRQKALSFQYGHALVPDTDYYDNTGLDEALVEQSKIIKYSAVTEVENESRVIVKIATENGGVLSPISNPQKDSFDAYIAEVKDAGVQVTVINFLPDRLYLNMRIFYDPLVLDAQGNSIINGGKPVEAAIYQYLKELPFDGQLVLAHLTDALQKVEGVIIPQIDSAASSWIDSNINDYGNPNDINVKVTPVSGYFKIVDFSNITYVV